MKTGITTTLLLKMKMCIPFSLANRLSLQFEPNFSDVSMPPRSTGIHAVGEALQSETNRKISDRYQPTKSISTSITNPPPLVPQDLPRQSATSEVGADADNGMGLVLFTNDPSSQEVQSPIHHFENEGGTSEIIRKRFKTADGNVIPLPLSTELCICQWTNLRMLRSTRLYLLLRSQP